MRLPATATALLHDGQVMVTEDVRADGTVVYHLASSRLNGVIVARPDVRDNQPVPDKTVIQLGDGGHILATHLDDLPVVDGFTVIGGGVIDLDHPQWQNCLALHGMSGPPRHGGRPVRLPAPATTYLNAVITLIIDRYRHLDQPTLVLAAARATADVRLRRWTHQQILPSHQLRTETAAEVTAAQHVAEQLQALSPLRLLPLSNPCSGG